jgi:hypothetical protein
MSKIILILLLSLPLQRSNSFVFIDEGLIQIDRPLHNSTDFHLAMADLRILAKQLKLSSLMPDNLHYDQLSVMKEHPHKKFVGVVQQINWWIKNHPKYLKIK